MESIPKKHFLSNIEAPTSFWEPKMGHSFNQEEPITGSTIAMPNSWDFDESWPLLTWGSPRDLFWSRVWWISKRRWASGGEQFSTGWATSATIDHQQPPWTIVNHRYWPWVASIKYYRLVPSTNINHNYLWLNHEPIIDYSKPSITEPTIKHDPNIINHNNRH